MSSENKRMAVTHENLYAKGFGIIPQEVMFDVTLSVKSKALYAYFCSFSGSGHSVYPSRETILADMNISKEVYYNALNPLIEAGYIKIEKAKGFINKNVFVISNTPTTVNCTPAMLEDTEKSTLSFEGINANGFGIIPKMVMCDNELTITAKALLAFFYSLAASGACVFPKRSIILNSLGISKTTYYKALDLVIERGYAKVTTRRSKNGRFAINNYILTENPQPCPKNPDNVRTKEKCHFSPCPKKPDNENDRVLKNQTIPCPKNPDTNSIIFNSNSKISTSNLNVSTSTRAIDNVEIRKLIQRISECKNYEKLKTECDKSDNPHIKQFAQFARLYLKVVKIICEMATSTQPIVNKDTVISKQEFMDALMSCRIDGKLSQLIEDIVYHYEILKQKYAIKYPKQYLKPVIWQHIENFEFDTDWWSE